MNLRGDIALAVMSGSVKAGTPLLFKAVGRLLSSALSRIREPGRRMALATELFLPHNSPFDVVPSRHHPRLERLPDGTLTYPNQIQAIEGIRGLFPFPQLVEDNPYAVTDGWSRVCVGSPSSNLFARTIFGDPWKGELRFDRVGLDHTARWKYTIKHLDGAVERIQDGKRHVVPTYCIINEREEIVAIPHHDPVNGGLKSDFLLVTRMPVEIGGSEIIFFSGLHGPSIRAIDLLLHAIDPDDLLQLQDNLDGERAYQAIFEVQDLKEEDGTIIPRKIRLCHGKARRPEPLIIQSGRTV